MSLRLRLIVAFFLFSVVPLAAVTFYSYASNVRALQVAAQHETEMLTGELTQRMQVVTTQISERVEHLMDMPVSAGRGLPGGPNRPQDPGCRGGQSRDQRRRLLLPPRRRRPLRRRPCRGDRRTRDRSAGRRRAR